jgi:hypothetical protein
MRTFIAVVIGIIVYVIARFALALLMFQALLFLADRPAYPLSWAAVVALTSEILAGLIALKIGFYIHRRISAGAT